jgi:protein-disulfide isomerase
MRFLLIAAALMAALLLFGCAGQPINEGVDAQGRAYRGAANSKLVIYEYSDFECPFCGRVQPTVEGMLRAYPNDVRLYFRHFPLDAHPRAMPSALAGVCAEEQGKFWPMHDKLFSNQNALSDSDLKKYAADAGLDSAKFGSCLSSQAALERVKSDMAEAAAAGVEATPSFKIGESMVRGAQPFSKFKEVIDSELARR